MQERFSDRARHAMALANQEANKLHHNDLTPAHLMLGLVAEGACVATETLKLLSVDLNAVRDEVRAEIKAGEDDGHVGARAHTKDLKDVIAAAIEEARKFGHKYVGTEHLIIGLLARGDSVPARALRNRGVDIEILREKTLAVLQSDVDANHDLAHSRHGDFEWVHQQELAKAFRSPKFWHTMILAVDSANRLGAGEVEPIHLLLALLRDTPNGINDLLKEKGVTADWVRSKLTTNN